MLISHLGEPISLRKLTDEVYANAPKGRRWMDERDQACIKRNDRKTGKERKKRQTGHYKDFDRANYEEVRQCCNDLEDYGIINPRRDTSLISLDLRAFINEIFKTKNVDKKKVDWKSLITLMIRQLKSATIDKAQQEDIIDIKKKLRRLQDDSEEARALRATSTTSLSGREITFLMKRLDTDRLRELCDSLRVGGMLDYIRGQSNIVNLFIALIKGDGINVDDGLIVDDWTTLELLGLKGIDTTPITDTVIQSFLWRSGYPEVVEFHNRYYVSRPLD